MARQLLASRAIADSEHSIEEMADRSSESRHPNRTGWRFWMPAPALVGAGSDARSAKRLIQSPLAGSGGGLPKSSYGRWAHSAILPSRRISPTSPSGASAKSLKSARFRIAWAMRA